MNNNNISERLYIGLTDLESDYPQTWSWSDGSLFDWHYWYEDAYTEIGKCTVITEGHMRRVNCTDGFRYVCNSVLGKCINI